MDSIAYRLVLIVLYLFFVLLFLALRKKSFSLPVVFLLSLALALVRSGQFIAYAILGIPTYPIEISHISYFLTCAILLSGIPQLQYVGGFYSFLSGLGYFVGAMLSPSSMMAGLGTFEFALAILSHSQLFFFGLMLLFGVTLTESGIPIFALYGQDNVGFYVEGDGIVLRDCHFANADRFSGNLTNLTYAGTVVETRGDDIRIEDSILEKGRNVLRSFSCHGFVVEN